MVLVVLFLLLLTGCTENFLLNSTGSGGDGSGLLDSAITNVTIEPSQFEMVNGDQATARVRAFAGGFEIRDFTFTASIVPNQSIVTILETDENSVRFKAENPGFTNLNITVRPGIGATAQVRVVAASE